MARPLALAVLTTGALAHLEDTVRLAYLAVRARTDDRGRLRASTAQLARLVYPLLARAQGERIIARSIEQLVGAGVLRYASRADGTAVLRHVRWNPAFERSLAASRRTPHATRSRGKRDRATDRGTA